MPKRKFEYSAGSFLSACSNGDLDYVTECIREIPADDINKTFDNHKFGPLHHAVRGHSIECIRTLLTLRSLNVREKTYEGSTPLLLAIEDDCPVDIIQLLVQHDPGLIDIPNNEDVYPMHLAITNRRSLEIVKLLVDTLKRNGLPLIDHVDLDGDSSILLAARVNHFEILEYLIDNTPYDVKHTNRTNGLNAFSAVFLMRNAIGLDPQRENAFRVLQKVFPLIYGHADKPLLVNEILTPMTLSMIFDNYQYTEWLIQNFYLDSMNDHRQIAQRTYDFIRSNQMRRKAYSMVFPLHSHLTREAFVQGRVPLRKIVWQEIYRNAIEVFQVDRDLFREIYAIFSDKFECPSHLLFTASFVDIIYPMIYDESMLVEFLLKTNTFNSIDGNQSVAELAKRIRVHGLRAKDIIPSYLAILMPFTGLPSADSILKSDHFQDGIEWMEVLSNETRENIIRFCGQAFHRDPMPLTMLCRVVIRKAVFPTNQPPPAGEIDISAGQIDIPGCERLVSLNLPKTLKNFIRYNYTNYDLSSN